ncbi:hypothetical protein BGW80DRAFT_286823 [Lactifluus volemus]|nr:hypothetical protein BGW80DRAFT_286823 [Lactifluus volemus]
MSTSAVLMILSLFTSHVLADISSPPCTVSSSGWTFNSLGQNPCTVAAYILSTCNGSTYDIQALPQGSSYYANSVAGANNACKCSGVVYSLLSSCDACQGDLWITWGEHACPIGHLLISQLRETGIPRDFDIDILCRSVFHSHDLYFLFHLVFRTDGHCHLILSIQFRRLFF